MAIIAFTGTPGSGKTYDAVKKILKNLQIGRVIYTNIDGLNDPICREMIKNVCDLSDLAITKQLIYLEDYQIDEFWMHISLKPRDEKGPGPLIVLDEVQKIFSSREWQSSKNKQFASWCSTHRHYGYELVLITQDSARLDTAVRSLLEWCYVYRKVNFFGSLVQNSYLRYAYAGDTAAGPPLKKAVRGYDRTVFLCYQSYAAKDIKEQGIMQHVNVLKHPVFYILPLLLAFTLYMFFGKSSFSKGDLFGTKAMLAKTAVHKPAGAPAAPASGQVDAHAPTIKKSVDASGTITFSNRSSGNGA